MRRLLAYPTWMLLVALVGVSAALRAWAGDAIATPWIAPDELIYAELGRAFWSTGHLTLFGEPTRFFSFLSPALAGLPLSLSDREAGYELLKALQAVVMSLAAVPAYLWARELTSRGWALVAAVLALAPPGLAYSGLIMTEVAFYPAFVLAAWAVWRALAFPSPRTQLLALGAIVLLCAVRLQGFVVGLAYLTAIAVDFRRWRLHVPVLAGVTLLGLAWCAWQLRNGGPLTKVLGAYQAAGETHYDIGTTARYVLYHLGDVVLVCGVVPALALGLLARERDLRAFVVLALALIGWLAVQVGMFASVHIGYTAERNLFGLVPLLGIAFVVWLARGAPRPLPVAGAIGAVCLLLLVTFPFETFSTLAAAPSNFSLVPLHELADDVDLDLLVPLAGAVLLVAAMLAPRVALAFVLALGLVASVVTSRFIVDQSRTVQQQTVGPVRQWIDVDADVTFLYSSDLNWETVWQTAFWNGQVRNVYGLLGAQVPGGIPQRIVGPFEEGRLVLSRGEDAPAEYAVASNTVTIVGEKLGQTPAGYSLWRVAPPFRIATWVLGVDTSSYSSAGEVEVRAYACVPSTLRVTVVAPEQRAVEIERNGGPYGRVDLEPNVAQELEIPASAPEPIGQRLCTFVLRGDGPFFATGLSLR